MKQVLQTSRLFLHGPARMEMVATLSRRKEEQRGYFGEEEIFIFPAHSLRFPFFV